MGSALPTSFTIKNEAVYMIKFTDREVADALMQPLDYNSQLETIKELLKCHKEAEHQLSAKIDRETEQLSNIENNLTIDSCHISMVISDFRNDLCLASFYQSAAHSMAAVGMLAPLVESIFYQVFRRIGSYYGDRSELPNPGHLRWKIDHPWNCHLVCNSQGSKEDDLVRGIMQLSEIIGLMIYLPQNLKLKLNALFAYRNKMFHCGFEWPEEDRRKFENRIQNDKWPDDWFNNIPIGGNPWIFYMTDKFILDWLSEIEQILEGIGAFFRNNNSLAIFILDSTNIY
jgi:hypothetical protein